MKLFRSLGVCAWLGVAMGADDSAFCWVVEGPPGSEVVVSYADGETLRENVLRSNKELKRSEEEQITTEFAVPLGGRVDLALSGSSEQVADPRSYEVQVLDAAGKELARMRGKSEEGNPMKLNKAYQAFMWIDVPAKWEGTLTVKVYFSPAKKMRVYTVKRGTAEDAAKVVDLDPFAKPPKEEKEKAPVKEP